VQEDAGDVYSLWVVAYGVLVRYWLDGTIQTLTETEARTVRGVDWYGNTLLMTRAESCGFASTYGGIFRWDGAPGGTQVAHIGYASCLDRPIAIASPTTVYATYAGNQIVELTPAIEEYVGESIATVPDGDVAAVVADVAVSPVTFAPEPGGAGAALAALAALCARTRRRRRAALLAVFLPATAFAAGRPVLRGDVLVSADKIYHVRRDDGTVSVLTPRDGSGPNLLVSPRGIAVTANREVLVVDTGRVISIDPRTGAQFVVQGTGGAPDLGTSPRGVDANPRDPSIGFFRSIFVASKGELLRIDRSGLSATATQVAPYPQGWENYEGEQAVVSDPGSGPLDAWVSNFRGLLFYDGQQDAFTPFYTELQGVIGGFDLSPAGVPFITRVAETCPSNDNGLYYYDGGMFPLATGGDLACAYELAFEPGGVSPFEAIVMDLGAQPARLVRVTLSVLELPVVTPFATLPNGVYPNDLAVAPVALPEPAGAPLVAWLALLLGAARAHLVPRRA
jgi:hypothetical protein